MDERVLRFHVDSRWTTEDMRLLISSLNDLYLFKLALQKRLPLVNRLLKEAFQIERGLNHQWNESFFGFLDYLREQEPLITETFNRNLKDAASYHFFWLSLTTILKYEIDFREDENFPLKIHKLTYASPGSFDFAGIGKIFESFCKYAVDLVKFYDSEEKRKRRLENEKIEQELKKGNIALNKEYMDLELQREKLREQKLINDEREERLIKFRRENAANFIETTIEPKQLAEKIPQEFAVEMIDRKVESIIILKRQGKIVSVEFDENEGEKDSNAITKFLRLLKGQN